MAGDDSRKIDLEELNGHGIGLSSKVMMREGEVVEVRSRLEFEGGTTSLTKTLKAGWQKSHKHEHTIEVYVVLAGWIAYVKFNELGPVIDVLHPGDTVTAPPNELHAIYESEGTYISASKVFLPGYIKPDQIFDSKFDGVLAVWSEHRLRVVGKRK